MKNMIAVILLMALIGCASASETDWSGNKQNLTEKEAADQIVTWAAGYCKGMEDKHGMNFTTCFKRVTDRAIEKLQVMSKAHN